MWGTKERKQKNTLYISNKKKEKSQEGMKLYIRCLPSALMELKERRQRDRGRKKKTESVKWEKERNKEHFCTT